MAEFSRFVARSPTTKEKAALSAGGENSEVKCSDEKRKLSSVSDWFRFAEGTVEITRSPTTKEKAALSAGGENSEVKCSDEKRKLSSVSDRFRYPNQVTGQIHYVRVTLGLCNHGLGLAVFGFGQPAREINDLNHESLELGHYHFDNGFGEDPHPKASNHPFNLIYPPAICDTNLSQQLGSSSFCGCRGPSYGTQSRSAPGPYTTTEPHLNKYKTEPHLNKWEPSQGFDAQDQSQAPCITGPTIEPNVASNPFQATNHQYNTAGIQVPHTCNVICAAAVRLTAAAVNLTW
ncbi:uncharacterized protein MELLADRAFT_111945 [Melampsora larici-populina 98AG31]|uniref:Uncharacterized protein n=1 Tax=Melampsora larici-populina (strain 98AG31 / pathotype 3-4-7) TaxID=747676 RepID=F4S4W0_MELLP|nr:uncharacterized protein MELLADRAFT_111945 [Melampsora larici-populina 98AG31]EGG00359.1 hypothetical protein MELLADRAFT_111945 [Melampsora larici-populina 98AG31]